MWRGQQRLRVLLWRDLDYGSTLACRDTGRKVVSTAVLLLNSFECLTTMNINICHHHDDHQQQVGFRHDLRLKSCYNGELPYTNYTADFKGIIDYIFYSVDGLAPIRILGPVPDDVMQTFDGCPNPHFPSDHLPLFAELAITKPVKLPDAAP
jgi:hypothetical protein